MNPTPRHAGLERLYELLADQASVGLKPSEQFELRELLARFPNVDPNCLDEASAALQLAVIDDDGPNLPLELMLKLEAEAAKTLGLQAKKPKRGPGIGRFLAIGSGWLVAAFFGLLLILPPKIKPKIETPEPTLAEQLREFRELFPARFRSDEDTRKPAGEVVWKNDRQRGFLALRNLPPNDPSKMQYQLWIVDKARPLPEPVDGGVFNVGADGAALVPLRPALALREPVLFAVTEEPPGGVVVSPRGKLGEFVVVMKPVEPE